MIARSELKKNQVVLVSGASGFVGQSLCYLLRSKGILTRALGRDLRQGIWDEAVTGDLGGDISNDATRGVETIVHLAARVHIMRETVADPLKQFRKINTDGTKKLAEQAVRNGVKRFIYLSSIKVNGEQSGLGVEGLFKETDSPCLTDPYALSKYEAEQNLKDIANKSNLEVVILRPPLVYGPGVKANFLRLVSWVEKGIPLPLLSIKNKRSMVSVFNLVDLIKTCIDHPRAAGETFLVSDGNDLSTAELIQHIAKAMNKPSRLFSMPVWSLNALAKATGKTEDIRRLCGSLQVDISKAENILGWIPPVSVDEGIQRTVDWFLEKNNKS